MAEKKGKGEVGLGKFTAVGARGSVFSIQRPYVPLNDVEKMRTAIGQASPADPHVADH